MAIEDTNPDNKGTVTVAEKNLDNKWQNKGNFNSNYRNKDSFQKSKFENSRKRKYDNKYDNQSKEDRLNKEQVIKLIEATIKCIMQQNLHRDVNEVKQQTTTDNTTTPISDTNFI